MDIKKLFILIKNNFDDINAKKFLDYLYVSFNSNNIKLKHKHYKTNFPKKLNNIKDIKNTYAVALYLANNKKYFESYCLLKFLSNNLPQALDEVHYNIGKILNTNFKPNLALKYLNKSLKLNGKNIATIYEIGLAHQRLGKIKSSEKYFYEAFSIEPKFAEAHRLYSLSHNYENDEDSHLKLMLNILNNEKKLDISQTIQFNFAIGKAFEDVKYFEKAFKYYKDGNNLRRRQLSYSDKNNFQQLDTLKRITLNIISKKTEIKKTNKKIIFIVGMPRSGTTLLEQIISSHSKISSLGEPLYFPNAIKKFFPEVELNLFEKSFDNISKKKIQYFREYIFEMYNINNNFLGYTDKLPFNFRFIGLINFFIPEAKIIHIRRSPQDTCLSIFKNYFQGNHLGFAYDQKELASYYQEYLNIMEYWNKIKCDFFEVKYEKLVKNIETQSKEIFRYLDIPFESGVIKYYNNTNVVSSLSLAQVRKKNYTSSIDSWKNFKNFLIDEIKDLK